MPQALPRRARSARLQIRVSVDEHMADLYGWLLAMPPTLRGRELVAQARVARAFLTSAARAPMQPDVGALPAPAAAASAPAKQLAVALGEQAVAQARSRLALGFFTAVPPPA